GPAAGHGDPRPRALGRHRPVAAGVLLGPAELRLTHEDLAGRAAEVERLDVCLLVKEVGPGLAGEQLAERAVRMAQAKAMRVRRLGAVGAEEVALDVRGHVAVFRRCAGAEPEARLASVEGHLVRLVLTGGGADGN